MYKQPKTFSQLQRGNKFYNMSTFKFLRDNWNYPPLKNGCGELNSYMCHAGKTELSHDLERLQNDHRWFIPEKLEKLYEVL